MRRLAVAAILVVGACVGTVSIPAAQAASFVCNELGPPNVGMTANVPGDVVIPDDGQCNTFGFNIGGTVHVGHRAKLFVWAGPANTSPTIIGGSIIATGPKQVNVAAGSRVDGDIIINGPNESNTSNTFGGFVCGSFVGGNIKLSGLTAGRWVIGDGGSSTETGSGEVLDFSVPGHPDLTCNTGNSFIGGSVTAINNQGVQTIEVASNANIGNSVTFTNNFAVFERFEIEVNSIGASLSCHSNTKQGNSGPGVHNGGEPNTVGGFRSGQCATPANF